MIPQGQVYVNEKNEFPPNVYVSIIPLRQFFLFDLKNFAGNMMSLV